MFVIVARVFSFRRNDFGWCPIRHESQNSGGFHVHHGCSNYDGASLVSVLKNWEDMSMDYLSFYIVGFVSAFVFALISIRFFLKLISKVKLMPFAIYRLSTSCDTSDYCLHIKKARAYLHARVNLF